MTTVLLPGQHQRARWMRMDAASILKRFYFCERSLISSQAGWLAAIAQLDVKCTLPRLTWEDVMTANALRERVFELRYPVRLLEIGNDTPIQQVFDEAIHAPSAEAFILSLARVFKPALLHAYQSYLDLTDEIADGPSLRFLKTAIQEKADQVKALTQFADAMLATAPDRRMEAEAWASELGDWLSAVGGLSVEEPHSIGRSSHPIGYMPFNLAEVPARDPRFHLCRFYWPDIIDPTFPYGQGLQLQLRSAVSHLNEVWAVETGGAILNAFANTLDWEFIYDAARWTYDESRHCRMGYERLMQWGYEPREIPLGTYIFDSAYGQDPIYRLGMLFYFETKNIQKKPQRARAFSEYHDHVSQHDMEFDWADETIHAHYGTTWLGALHQLRPTTYPEPEAVRDRCNALIDAVVQSATDAERIDIHSIAQAMIDKATRFAASL